MPDISVTRVNTHDSKGYHKTILSGKNNEDL